MNLPSSGTLEIAVEAFRAFRDRAVCSIRPLTLFYGRNQAGKSTLLRILPLLADSLVPGAGVLDLQSPALRGATFKELGWLGPEPVMTPRISLGAQRPDGTTVGITLKWADVGRRPVLNDLVVEEDGRRVLDASLSGERALPPDRWEGVFTGRFEGGPWTDTLACRGLLPAGLPARAQAVVDALAKALLPLQRVQWLHAGRCGVEHAPSTRPARMFAPDGADLALQLRGESGLLKRISEWTQRAGVLGEGVALQDDSSGRPGFVLGAEGSERLPLRLAGEGARALLPIVAHAVWAESRDSRAATMLAIEEPEAHLHPEIQTAVLDRLVETASAGIPVVLETHSATLLRAMQKAVLDGRLRPQDVGVYWVDRTGGAASVRAITVTPEAILQNWPPAVLDEEQKLARQVALLRWERGGGE